MEQIRARISDMTEEEERLLVEREAARASATTGLQAGVALVIAVMVALAIFAIALVERQTEALIISNEALQTADDQLIEEAARREELEAQLRQSHKLEAIGQLTGGIAHDFNNMLGVIVASLNILKRRLARGEGAHEQFIDAAMEGAERAANLIHRLLAFSRLQPLAPTPLDANKFVAGMSNLLRRTLGEHVRLETALAGGLWLTEVDPNELESAILNLAVNARDAMPDGGRLTIETGNALLDDAYARTNAGAKPGEYVLVAVSDTGTGMSPEVAAKAFDPFFTTKAVGKGTGLGLSQVYGFVKQSGGQVSLHSELGVGTTIKIYLPRYVGPVAAASENGEAAKSLPLGKADEVILIVEDDEHARRAAVESVRELGYTVLHADGAGAALEILANRPDVVLLLTDVVMPDVDGKKLSEEALRRRPDLRVLFMSGYARDAIVQNELVGPKARMLAKPFTLEQAARKIREILDAP
jgi:signal transduction histidine kinase